MTYYQIAVNDLEYLQPTLSFSKVYNPIVVQAQQIAEWMLKSVAELVCTESIEDVLKTHNLKKIYLEICKYDKTIRLSAKDLGFLKDFYFEAKYPGENFILVDRQMCNECLEVMYSVIAETNRFRQSYGYEVKRIPEIYVPETLQSADAF